MSAPAHNDGTTDGPKEVGAAKDACLTPSAIIKTNCRMQSAVVCGKLISGSDCFSRVDGLGV